MLNVIYLFQDNNNEWNVLLPNLLMVRLFTPYVYENAILKEYGSNIFCLLERWLLLLSFPYKRVVNEQYYNLDIALYYTRYNIYYKYLPFEIILIQI